MVCVLVWLPQHAVPLWIFPPALSSLRNYIPTCGNQQTHSLSCTMSSILWPSLSHDSCKLLTHRDTSLFCCSLVAFCHLQAAWVPAHVFAFLPSFFLPPWIQILLYSVGLNINHWPKLADLISNSSQIIDSCYPCKHMVCKFLIPNLALLCFQNFYF